jgi:hypothetical protein
MSGQRNDKHDRRRDPSAVEAKEMKDLLIVGVVVVTAAVVSPAYGQNCSALAPSMSPSTNLANINACLAGGGVTLTAGTYRVSGCVAVPPNAALTGVSGGTYPTIQLSAVDDCVVRPASGTTVSYVTLDGNNLLAVDCCSATVQMGYSGAANATMHDVHVTGGKRQTTNEGAGVVFFEGSNNLVSRAQIMNNFAGVVATNLAPSVDPNIVDSGSIYNNLCDSVQLPGYARITNNHIYQNGPSCGNGIPGGGIYSLQNTAGADIQNNDVYNNCGNDLDLANGSHFTISGNTFDSPGYQTLGSFCAGVAGSLIDVSASTIQANTFQNNVSTNTVDRTGGANYIGSSCGTLRCDSNCNCSCSNRAGYGDLPGGPNTVVGFVLGHVPTQFAYFAENNTITGNAMRAYCTAPCYGLGYFSSRGTGYGWTGTTCNEGSWFWSGSTTNYYTLNDPYGANIGSDRCGANWYAANTTCSYTASPSPCNTDDYQHNSPTGDWERSDAVCDTVF